MTSNHQQSERTIRNLDDLNGSEEAGDASHPDVIIETSDQLFVVEVKYTDSEAEIELAERQALDHMTHIVDIGWWPNIETKHPVVVWTYYDVTPSRGIEL